ncbi:3-dehydroquinate synthase, partial [bacterium]|nr:3-dehydroquinate synthase [bacterium]
ARNIAIKAKVVVEDEHETTGTRALLNFGHTIGHGIEAAAGYGQLLHGEAISLGLIAAAQLSSDHSSLSETARGAISSLLEAFHLPTTLPETITDEAILGYLARDKKFEEGQIRFVLLRDLGDAFVSDSVSMDAIKASITALRG